LIHDDENGDYFIDYAFRGGFGNNGIWKGDKVRPDTVGQFTGYYDRNGIEIYEGDIIGYFSKELIVELDTVKGLSLKSANLPHVFYFEQDAGSIIFVKSEIEIIGNIHENRELLK
jgi:hypothetical protein